MAHALDLTRLTASQHSELLRSRAVSARELATAHLDRIAAVDGDIHAFLHVDSEGALAAADAIDAARAAGEELGPLAGVPLALKDVLTMKGAPTTCGSRILEDGTRRTTRPSPAGCAKRGSSSSARPTWTSSPWAPPPSTRRTARPTTPGTSTGSPEAREVAALPHSRPSRPRWRSAPTPVGRSASPLPSLARSASSPRMARSRDTGSWPWPPPWTKQGRVPERSSTPPSSTRSSPATTRWTPRHWPSPCPTSWPQRSAPTSPGCGSGW